MRDKVKSDRADGANAEDRAPEEQQQALLDQEICQHVDRLKRLQAEFDNYRKRMARDIASVGDRITDQAILDFLPLYDNLQRGFAAYKEDGDTEALVAGFEQIRAQFEQILGARGVERIDCMGTPFDPALHEALLSVDSDEIKNTIVDELTPGYLRDGRTLRVSQVVVSRGASDGAKEEER